MTTGRHRLQALALLLALASAALETLAVGSGANAARELLLGLFLAMMVAAVVFG